MKAVENERAQADELIAAFPDLYIHARMERRMPRAKRITTEGMIEICPGEACEGHEDDTYDLITVRGKTGALRRICVVWKASRDTGARFDYHFDAELRERWDHHRYQRDALFAGRRLRS